MSKSLVYIQFAVGCIALTGAATTTTTSSLLTTEESIVSTAPAAAAAVTTATEGAATTTTTSSLLTTEESVASTAAHAAAVTTATEGSSLPAGASAIACNWQTMASGSSYCLVLNSGLTFDEAASKCQTQGGQLSDVGSQDITNWLLERIVLSDADDEFWIGLYGTASGNWRWLSGNKHAAYLTDEPRREDSECDKCVTFRQGDRASAEWKIEDCDKDDVAGYICKQGIPDVPDVRSCSAIDEVCTDTTCKNGGSCVDNQCVCTEEWTGSRCQDKVDKSKTNDTAQAGDVTSAPDITATSTTTAIKAISVKSKYACSSCGDPPIIANTSFYMTVCGEAARYTCLPGYLKIGGKEDKFCEDQAGWLGEDLICTKSELEQKVEIFVPQKVLTDAEKYQASIGWTSADSRTSAVVTGSVFGITFISIILIGVILLDILTLKRHIQICRSNLKGRRQPIQVKQAPKQ